MEKYIKRRRQTKVQMRITFSSEMVILNFFFNFCKLYLIHWCTKGYFPIAIELIPEYVFQSSMTILGNKTMVLQAHFQMLTENFAYCPLHEVFHQENCNLGNKQSIDDFVWI